MLLSTLPQFHGLIYIQSLVISSDDWCLAEVRVLCCLKLLLNTILMLYRRRSFLKDNRYNRKYYQCWLLSYYLSASPHRNLLTNRAAYGEIHKSTCIRNVFWISQIISWCIRTSFFFISIMGLDRYILQSSYYCLTHWFPKCNQLGWRKHPRGWKYGQPEGGIDRSGP